MPQLKAEIVILDWKKKQGPAALCTQETNFKYNDSHK